MTAPAAVRGTFADLKFIRSRSVCQIVVELPIEEGAAVVAAFGTPQPGAEVPVAVARLRPEAVKAEPTPKRGQQKVPWHEMSRAQQAGVLCSEMRFWRFLSDRFSVVQPTDSEEAARTVRRLCRVESRADLDDPARPACGKSWDALDEQYRAWLDAPKYGAA